MRVTAVAAVVALALSFAGPSGADDAASGSAATDTAQAAFRSLIPSIRAAYENAWAQRQAGDHQTAIRVAESALAQIARVLDDLPMASRLELTELQSQLEGLRDAARHDLESAAARRASGKGAEENAKGTEEKSPEASAKATEGKAKTREEKRGYDALEIEEIEAQINPDVANWIAYFNDRGRSTFERWLKRSGRYAELFRKVLQNEGLPADLVHLVFVESGFNLYARSSSNAVGPWQFLRSTGRLFGLTVNPWLDERKDPEKSTVAAARYLKHLYGMFKDWPLALASYNAGEGTVLRAIKRQGTTNYWDLRLPRQTEDYVPQFMAVLAISKDPEKYGFDSVELDEPMTFDEVAFTGAVDLAALAKLADCTVKELRDLNPAMLQNSARGVGNVTTLRVPHGKGEILLKRLQDGATLPAVNLKLKHRVRRGETLQGIANQYHVSAKQLARANGIARNRHLRRGTMLTVPVGSAPPAPIVLENGDPRGSTSYVPGRRGVPRERVKGTSSAEGRMTVTVRKGETLATIAQRYGVTTAEVMRWNHLKSSRVRRGTRLKIRADEPVKLAAIQKAAQSAADSSESSRTKAALPDVVARGSSQKDAEAAMRVVVVKRGDTLATIAQRHGTSVVAIQRLNRLSSARIRVGQKLKLPTT